MKTLLFILLGILFTSCTSVTTQVVSSENGHVVMNSTEEYLFSSPKEKLQMTFSPENGGQILSIYWEGLKIAEKFSESYPNVKLDFKGLKPRVIDDGSGLIIVDSKVRDEYQLRRSYSLKYLEGSDEHVIEVIYNVKNYSSEIAIDQQWIQSLSLPPSLKVNIDRNSINSADEHTQFQIEAINVKDLTIEINNNNLKLNNVKPFKLGTKERLSWKVLYKLKSID